MRTFVLASGLALLTSIALAAGAPEILLRDFRPVADLSLKETRVQRAKYPVIDFHTHINDALHTTGEWIPPEKLVAGMDRLNISKLVILTGKWGDELQKVIDYTVKPFPNRFVVFTQLDYAQIDDPQYATRMVKQIEDAYSRGARGLKFLKDFGLTVRRRNGELVKIDDERFNPIWEACARMHLPVAIHTADPDAFFKPVNEQNERIHELIESPTWSYADSRKFPTKKALIAARDRIFARNPKTTFIAVHMANRPEDLDEVSSLMRKYPNVIVDFGAREAELGRQPRRALQFFEEFQDRILFGTDWGFRTEQYQNYFRWLESDDEYFKYWDWPAQGMWMIYGMKLPDLILEKIYHKNAERVLGYTEIPGNSG
jgi:predicted TIM-barrel fold metal-dependent hydrolase